MGLLLHLLQLEQCIQLHGTYHSSTDKLLAKLSTCDSGTTTTSIHNNKGYTACAISWKPVHQHLCLICRIIFLFSFVLFYIYPLLCLFFVCFFRKNVNLCFSLICFFMS